MLDSQLQSEYFAQRTERCPHSAAVEFYAYKPLGGTLYKFEDDSVLDVNEGGRFAYASMDDYQAAVEHNLQAYDFDAGTSILNAMWAFYKLG